MSYYYPQPGVMPDKQSMYSPNSVPGSIPGSLSALGYPQQAGLQAGGGLPPSVANQAAASLSQQPSAVYSSGMQIPTTHFAPATYSQSPYASHAMYQSALNYQSQQPTMSGQASASAYMAAAAAEAQSTGSPYGAVRIPTTTAGYHTSSVPGGAPRGPSSLYGYPGSLNGQAAMFASHPSSMQPGMQPGMHPGMHPGVYQGMPGSSIPGLAAPQARPASGPYSQSPFARQLP